MNVLFFVSSFVWILLFIYKYFQNSILNVYLLRLLICNYWIPTDIAPDIIHQLLINKIHFSNAVALRYPSRSFHLLPMFMMFECLTLSFGFCKFSVQRYMDHTLSFVCCIIITSSIMYVYMYILLFSNNYKEICA